MGLSAIAAASQYPLDQAAAIISRPDAKKLHRAGIRTTLDILNRGRTVVGRQRLADLSGLRVDQIEAWTALSDLLRVRGIGPDVARLLTAVNIRTISDLQKADATAIAQAIQVVNRERHLSTNPPGAEPLGYWIGLSRGLPIVLEWSSPVEAH